MGPTLPCRNSLRFVAIVFALLLGATAVLGQSSSFTYQGRLTDGGTAANGNYDLQLALWDSAAGGTQIGSTLTLNTVAVSNGTFTVSLDFGASSFSGANRFLEISARSSGGGSFTLLTPRQQVTSTPYAIRSANASSADTATNATQLGGIAAGQYVQTNDSRLSDARPPLPGSSNYIQNSTNPQSSTSFNVTGGGTVGGNLTANGKVLIGTTGSNFKVEVVDPTNGLRVQTNNAGGTIASFGGNGDFQIDAVNNPGGRLVVKESGNVGIGIPVGFNPIARLDVRGDIRVAGNILLENAPSTDASSNLLDLFCVPTVSFPTVATCPSIHSHNGMIGINTVVPDATLSVNGTADKPGGGSWGTFSDERLKNIKGRFTPGLRAVMQLQPLRYEYKRDNALNLKSEGEHTGFSAQEVQKIIPEAVSKNDRGYLLVNNDPILWTMLNAIKEQQAQILTLQRVNSALSARIHKLERTQEQSTRPRRK